MKKTGFLLVIIGILVASLMLANIALVPQVAASSEKTSTKPANDAVGWCCPSCQIYCCNGNVCGCMYPSQCGQS
jgi:hypothetical protein